jgi:hypothetical protein
MARVPGMPELLKRTVTIDLFEPTQTERIREEVVKLRGEGVAEEQITRLIEEHPTKTAVQDAMTLHRGGQTRFELAVYAGDGTADGLHEASPVQASLVQVHAAGGLSASALGMNR